MEVAVASPSPPGSPTMDHFDFHGARISPNYLSAPASPKRFGEYYLSAPASPSRFSELYADFDYFSSSATPSKTHDAADVGDDGGFAFFVSGESHKSPSRSAEELFDGGRIKPLKEDELFESARSPLLSPAQQRPKRSPIAQGKKAVRDAFSPRHKKDSGSDAVASSGGEERRGRDRTPAGAATSSSRRVTRSLSPYRVSHYTWEEEQQHQHGNGNSKEDPNRGSSLSTTSSSSSSKSSRKWRLRDFLLFRSASEGRGTSKDPFRKYPAASFKRPEEGKASSSSFRNSEMPPRSRRKEPVSAHGLHYARKKAESEDLKKRTFLPYKQGILGRLAGFGF